MPAWVEVKKQAESRKQNPIEGYFKLAARFVGVLIIMINSF